MRCDRIGRRIVVLTVLALLTLGTASRCLTEESPSQENTDGKTVRVLIVYHSLSGNTERMAHGVADGVKRVSGAVAIVKKIKLARNGRNIVNMGRNMILLNVTKNLRMILNLSRIMV